VLYGYLGNGLAPSQFAKYACILKNSMAYKETTNERMSLLKDLAAVEEAVNWGAQTAGGESYLLSVSSIFLERKSR
jgi:hypothetical protein